MRKIILFLDKHGQIVFRFFLCLFAGAFILFLYPREGSFPYEFYKGKPWLHEDLISTFDFPVRKSNQELKEEKDSILKEFKPYFNFKKNIADEEILKFYKAFDLQWKNFADNVKKQPVTAEIETFFKNADSTVVYNYKRYASDLLLKIYKKGVIEVNDQMEQAGTKDFPLVIIRDNVGEEINFSDVFTPKLAYSYIIDQLALLKDGTVSDKTIYKSGFFKELNLSGFLLPNLIFNDEASRNVKNELIKQVSLTKGMFPSGSKVIAKGEVVNDEKYKILVSLKYEYENKLGHSNKIGFILGGQAIIIGCLIILLVVFLVHFRREIYHNNLKFSFVLLLITIFVGASSLITKRDWGVNLYVLPFAILPMIIKTFYDARLALFAHTVAILLIGFMAPNAFEFVFLNFCTGAIAIISLTNLYRRGKLFNTVFYVIAAYCILYFGLFLIQGEDLSKLSKDNFIFFGISGFLLLMAYPLIFIFEKTFGFLSDITLIELSDTNQPLLRKLNEKAPGTFQHSLQVANLAEEAAYKIGANPLLVRVGALYHDIGKMYNPMFFIENLSTEKNPHNDLSNEASARIIIGHVTKGIEIAHKHRLPEQIMDFIRTHHGTTTVQFFYRTYKLQNPNNEVDMSKFIYPGPVPFSKEMALIMMADSVEAASRSLREVSRESINDLVDNIIYYQMINEQYSESNITYKEIGTIKEIFKRKLMNIFHVRVEYPEAI